MNAYIRAKMYTNIHTNMYVHICRYIHIYIFICIHRHDEVYVLYVYATTTTIGTNTQTFSLLRIRAFQNLWTPNLALKKTKPHTLFKPLFGQVEKHFSPCIYIYTCIYIYIYIYMYICVCTYVAGYNTG